MTVAHIKKADDELQIVWGEVYAPMLPDSDTEFMTEESVRLMAYRFLVNIAQVQFDVNHDNNPTPCFTVESFVARDGDPDFIPGSWVVAVHIPDPALWAQVKNGQLNGFSLEALVTRTPKVLELEVPEVIEGETYPEQDHHHTFEVRVDDEGNFIGGRTDIVDGHYHVIEKGTVTEVGGTQPHRHRYSFLEGLLNDQAQAED